jgi:hypothetical protein
MQNVRTQGDWEGVESCVGSWPSFNKAIGVNNKVIYKRRVQAVPQIPIAMAEPTVAISMGLSTLIKQNTYLLHLLGQKRRSIPLSINLLLNFPCTMYIQLVILDCLTETFNLLCHLLYLCTLIKKGFYKL